MLQLLPSLSRYGFIFHDSDQDEQDDEITILQDQQGFSIKSAELGLKARFSEGEQP